MLKALFLKLKLNTVSTKTEEEVFTQWLLKLEMEKNLTKDKDLVEKAKRAVNQTLSGIKPEASDMSAYLEVRKKFKYLFNENNSGLVNPTATDVFTMDSLSLDEVDEMVDNSSQSLATKYYNSIIELYRSSVYGTIVRRTSGGLRRPTPTNDFIDDEVDSTHNPFDDLGVD